jgi:hypothetical protein
MLTKIFELEWTGTCAFASDCNAASFETSFQLVVDGNFCSAHSDSARLLCHAQ